MKRFLTVLLACLILSCPAAFAAGENTTQPAEAESVPILESLSFKNATIDGGFSPYVNDYTLTLDNPEISPTLGDFKVKGIANLFVNYMLDETHHQKGLCVTLEYDSGSTIYNFEYKNAYVYKITSNNSLLDLTGTAVEVYPKISKKSTNYRLYIPKDMTVLKLSAVTEDVSAYCNIPEEIEIAIDQTPVIPVTVTASNGETKLYKFTVKRVDKTTQEVEELMRSPDFKTLAEDELFYRNPLFYIILLSVAAGIALLLLLVKTAKRISVKAEDEDEFSFFEM